MKVFGTAAGLVLASALAACSRGGDPIAIDDPAQQVTSPDEVRLAVGEFARIDGILRIGFTGVPGDSRCPSSVVCVWQGDAAVEIQHGLSTTASSPDTLHTALDPQSVEFAGYRITLLEVGPYPSTPGPIPLREYTIRLRVTRLEQ